MTVTINGTTGIAGTNGSAGTPAVQGEDTNTGIFFPAADTVAVATAGSERVRVDSSGNLGLGVTPSAWDTSIFKSLDIGGVYKNSFYGQANGDWTAGVGTNHYYNAGWKYASNGAAFRCEIKSDLCAWYTAPSGTADNAITFSERMRIDSGGIFSVGCTSLSTTSTTDTGAQLGSSGAGNFFRSANTPLIVMRQTNDGTLVDLRQGGASEGSISVSGTTVSYNGGHLSRWAQFPDNSRPELLKGTVMSNLDQMSNWDNEDNEQLNCVQVSTVEGDPDVAGVFVAWDSTDDGYNDILLAMTGDMVIRIGAGVTVARGDLLMSAGDGTAKPQGDDIVRSKTIAKVTSTHVSHTYADGSYAVPCVLMAC
jgi:hypothetical protein